MTEHRSRRWFQWSLKSLFVLTLVVAAFFAGYALATRQAEQERRRAELEAQQAADAARLDAEAAAKPAQAAAVVLGLQWLARQQGEEWRSKAGDAPGDSSLRSE
jgi:uncharacterized protein YpmB